MHTVGAARGSHPDRRHMLCVLRTLQGATISGNRVTAEMDYDGVGGGIALAERCASEQSCEVRLFFLLFSLSFCGATSWAPARYLLCGVEAQPSKRVCLCALPAAALPNWNAARQQLERAGIASPPRQQVCNVLRA